MLSSVRAFLHIDGQKYDVYECEYQLYQTIDQTGKPSAKPSTGLINIIIESKDDTSSLANWAIENEGRKDGEIVFELLHNNKTKKVSFFDGICVLYQEFYRSDYEKKSTAPSLLLKLSISAKEIHFGIGAALAKKWLEI